MILWSGTSIVGHVTEHLGDPFIKGLPLLKQTGRDAEHLL